MKQLQCEQMHREQNLQQAYKLLEEAREAIIRELNYIEKYRGEVCWERSTAENTMIDMDDGTTPMNKAQYDEAQETYDDMKELDHVLYGEESQLQGYSDDLSFMLRDIKYLF